MKRSRTLILFSIMVALLFHLVIARLFKITPPQKLPLSQDPAPDAVMISRHETAQAWENTLYAFSRIQDPTLMTLPDYQRGFSLVQTQPVERPYQEIPAHNAGLELVKEAEEGEFFLPIASVDMVAELAESWSAADIPVPTIPQARVPAAIIWRTPDGEMLDHMPFLPAAEVRRALSVKPATGVTQIEIVRGRELARVKLLESSGNARLDQFVLNEIGKRISRLEALRDPYSAPYANAIYPKPGARTVIEVEWRFVESAAAASAVES